MSEPGTEFMSEVARRIANEPIISSSAVGSLATEWALCISEQPSERSQQAATAGFSSLLRPENASPANILKGELGETAQVAFFRGAIMALELVAKTRLASDDTHL